jgi:hypothetical protein
MQDPNLTYPSAEAQLQSLMAQFQQTTLLAPRDKKISRHKFSPDEDELLKHLVAQYGTTDWGILAQNFHGRTPRQLRDRWRHYLSPEVVTGNWTEADDQMLLSKVNELGQRWSAIAQLFPGRTDIGVKNHYISIVGRTKKDGGSLVPGGGIIPMLSQPAESRTFQFPGQEQAVAEPALGGGLEGRSEGGEQKS